MLLPVRGRNFYLQRCRMQKSRIRLNFCKFMPDIKTYLRSETRKIYKSNRSQLEWVTRWRRKKCERGFCLLYVPNELIQLDAFEFSSDRSIKTNRRVLIPWRTRKMSMSKNYRNHCAPITMTKNHGCTISKPFQISSVGYNDMGAPLK